VGDDSHVVFGKKFPGEKRKFVTEHCSDATASSFVAKVWGEVSAYLHTVAIKVTVVCGIDCLVCQNKFFVNNPLDVKENYEHALDSVLSEFGLFHWEDCCFVSGS
jgi:L-lysine 2,3-aminomutase